MDHGKSISGGADLETSFGLDDALRLKTLLEGQTTKKFSESKLNHNGGSQNRANFTEKVTEHDTQSYDLGSWTPLDLRRREVRFPWLSRVE